jgi:hypothetical protein
VSPDRHRHPKVSFRPPEDDREWLLAHAVKAGRPVNAILREALSDLRKKTEKESKP